MLVFTKKTIGKHILGWAVFLICIYMIAVAGVTNMASAAADDSVTDTVTANLAASCTLGDSTTTEAHTASLSNDSTQSNIGNTNIIAKCNDANGFSIFAVGYSDNSEGNTKLIGGSQSIETGTSGSDSYWAMQLNKSQEKTTYDDDVSIVNGFDSDSYHAVPSTYTRVAQKSSGLTPGSAVSVSATYKVYVSNSLYPGTYSGKVRYTLANPSSKECPDWYEMKSGVCTKQKTIEDLTMMQEFGTLTAEERATVLASMTVDVQYQLRDSRDGKSYWIAKLKDGNVWMTQNLDLDLNATTLPLTSATSDVSANWNPGSTYYTKTATSSSSTATDMYSWDLGDYVYDGVTNSDCGTSATSYADCTDYGFSLATSLAVDSTQRHYHVGNLYQWNAATAGSGGEITSGEATDSICPKGWRLPTSNTSGEFQVLSNTYGVTSGTEATGTVQTLIDSPLYFVRGGNVDSGTLSSAGRGGRYWSSTPNSNSSNAYYLYFGYTSSVNPSGNYNRYRGISVRCIAGS